MSEWIEINDVLFNIDSIRVISKKEYDTDFHDRFHIIIDNIPVFYKTRRKRDSVYDKIKKKLDIKK
jgi:hypothetical protein